MGRKNRSSKNKSSAVKPPSPFIDEPSSTAPSPPVDGPPIDESSAIKPPVDGSSSSAIKPPVDGSSSSAIIPPPVDGSSSSDIIPPPIDNKEHLKMLKSKSQTLNSRVKALLKLHSALRYTNQQLLEFQKNPEQNRNDFLPGFRSLPLSDCAPKHLEIEIGKWQTKIDFLETTCCANKNNASFKKTGVLFHRSKDLKNEADKLQEMIKGPIQDAIQSYNSWNQKVQELDHEKLELDKELEIIKKQSRETFYEASTLSKFAVVLAKLGVIKEHTSINQQEFSVQEGDDSVKQLAADVTQSYAILYNFRKNSRLLQL